MEKRKTIFLVCIKLTLGGAERLMLDILSCLDQEKYILHLVYAEKEDSCLPFVPGGVICHFLDKRKKRDFPRLCIALARLYKKEKPQLVISFLEYANYFSLLARLISQVKPVLIITVHNFLSMHHILARKRTLQSCFIRVLYPLAEQIITVSRGVLEDLAIHFGCPRQKMQTIYNSVNLHTISVLSKETITDPEFLAAGNIKRVIACGRLTYQKNYPLLLTAFARVLQQEKAHLFILGRGEDDLALKKLAGQLGIAEQVTFCGFKTNPYKYMAACDLFVLSSRYEGFGNVLIEAMACGTAVLSAACPAGPDEIITHKKNGWLVNPGHAEELVQAMLNLLHDNALRTSLASEGKKRAADFDVSRVIARYEQVIKAFIG